MQLAAINCSPRDKKGANRTNQETNGAKRVQNGSRFSSPTALHPSSTMAITSPKHARSAAETPSASSSSAHRFRAMPRRTGRLGQPSSVPCQAIAPTCWA